MRQRFRKGIGDLGTSLSNAMKTDAVIIGAGVAGLWCANELARMGLDSIIVEKAPYSGGHVAQYCCKATDQCQRCGACLLEDLLESVDSSNKITQYVRTTTTNVARENGQFSLTLTQQPLRIIPEKCNQCGKCLETCPETGAMRSSAGTNQPYIDEAECLFFKSSNCQACVDVCPERAIHLQGAAEEIQIESSAVVLASGFKAFDPTEKPRFGYGRVPGVITGLELESILRDDNFDSGEGEKKVESVAFIQCVGSRDPKIGHNYCSRVCCGYALRLARLLRRRFPEINPAMFYMDIQSFDRDFEKRLATARKEVRLIRAIPSDVHLGSDGRPELVYRGPDENKVFESFDLVVLSVGIAPDPTLRPLAEVLGIKPNADAFLGPDGDGVLTDSNGIFVAGAVQGPKSIEEAISHAIRTAGEVASYVNKTDKGEGL
jgi:heterodisulfide reductase subunit A